MAHAGGFGGGFHPGGTAAFGGGQRFDGGHLGLGDHIASRGTGLSHQALHQYGRYRSAYGFYGAYPDCYDWYDLHPNAPLPLSCG
ncbi:hypothetical protein CO683_17825 [Bradyrhizobium ottawaense]|uniref:Uncharacterized protein n=2 Tax=Nitrobacteraceae TaxID=41294 RepID=A0A2U8PH41_9BRAD|nr:hypothetical protein CIT37_36885 [Bradyrhizobium ottawaense]PDT68291.1 hypothetical protein CO683_17825 [Bradyrhizobium ottawaense]